MLLIHTWNLLCNQSIFRLFIWILETNIERISYYCELNGKIEKISKILHFCVVFLTEIATVVPFVIVTIVNYTIYDQGDESFYLPFPVVYVWYIIQLQNLINHQFWTFLYDKPKNPLRFKWAVALFNCINCSSSCSALYPLLCSAGNCIYDWIMLDVSFIEDITSGIDIFRTKKIPNSNHNQMKEHFCKIIQLYSDVKQLSDFINVPKTWLKWF